FLQQPPARIVNRPVDAVDLIRHMQTIRELRSIIEPILDGAGAPGHAIVMFANQLDVVPKLKTLAPPEREALAHDWQAAYAILQGERQALLQQLRLLHWRGRWLRRFRFLGEVCRANFDLVLLAVAIVALNLAFASRFPVLRQTRLIQGLAFALLAGVKLGLWLLSRKPLPTRQETARLR